MNDEQYLLASAYVDGALTSEERARAEADPDVMAAVARLHDLRGDLGDVEPADPARREAAISAALDVFDGLAAKPTPVAPVTPLHSRRRGGWLVSAAAAALVVVVAGGIIAVNNDNDGDDDAGGDAAMATLSDEGAVTEAAETVPGATLAAQSTADARSDEAGGAGTMPAADSDATAAPGTTTAAAAEGTITATYGAVILGSPDDLAMYADNTLRVGVADDMLSVPTCDEGTWLGSATYLMDGVETAVEVFLAADGDEVLAVDASTCDVVARTPAP
jgi:hypothetical protein